MTSIVLQQWKCNSCGHTWYPRIIESLHVPAKCPRCQKKTIEVVGEGKP